MHQLFDLSKKESISNLRKNFLAKIEENQKFIEESLQENKNYRIFLNLRKNQSLQLELELKIELELFYHFCKDEAIEFLESEEIEEKIKKILFLFKNSEKFYFSLEFEEFDKIS